jgi:serine/threonine protein phosphatase PrpC
MEDTFCLNDFEDGTAFVGAIFDGHSGDQVSNFAEQRFPELILPVTSHADIQQQFKNVFNTIHEESKALPGNSGAVAVAFFTDGDHITIANVGDAEAVLVTKGFSTTLTEMHRISNAKEVRRCMDRGALIERRGYVCIPSGKGLIPTRSLGDHEFTPYGLLSEPYTHQWTTQDPYYLILACDGLWDVVNLKTAAAICDGKRTAQEACKALAAIAQTESGDNVTVIVIRRT